MEEGKWTGEREEGEKERDGRGEIEEQLRGKGEDRRDMGGENGEIGRG